MDRTAKKLKILYLLKILMEETDEENALDMEEILAKLELYGISAERKSIYDDMAALREYGVDVVMEKKDRNSYYHIVSRQFEIAELKLLVDCVQAARFITKRKSDELIRKIEGIASKYEASQLQHQVFVTERVKSQNERILYNIDAIHRAIEENSQITFKYTKINSKKKLQLRRGGEKYLVSPWALTLAEENYYLVAYDHESDMIKYFRVDKIRSVELNGFHRFGRRTFAEFDIADYAKKRFRMYDGPETVVRLRCKDEFADVIFDRFGTDIIIHDQGNGCFEVNVEVALSRHFYAWVMAMNDSVVIAGPAEVVEDAREFVKELRATYR